MRRNEAGRMIVTHCGSDIIKDEPSAGREIRRLADERGVDVEIAHDGMERVFR